MHREPAASLSDVARGLGDAKTPPHSRASAVPSAGQE